MPTAIRHALFDLDRPDSDDAVIVHAMIRRLAEVQDAEDQMVAPIGRLRQDGAGDAPRFRALIAETGDGRAVGLALYYFTYSTWVAGAKLYVEDLYVDPEMRSSGLGRRLMGALARVAIDEGCVKLNLSVKTDNHARAFYEKLGLQRSGTWLPYAVAGEALERLSEAR